MNRSGLRLPAHRMIDGVIHRQDVANGPWAPLTRAQTAWLLSRLDGMRCDVEAMSGDEPALPSDVRAAG